MNTTPVSDHHELERLKKFLQANQLPCEDLEGEKLKDHAFVLYTHGDGTLIGSGGLEFYGNSVLLRSVAVSPSFRGRKYGQQIVNDLKERAIRQGSKSMYLLTETAPDFFSNNGFIKIDRIDAPEEIKLSSEFSHLCPATAVCMKFDL